MFIARSRCKGKDKDKLRSSSYLSWKQTFDTAQISYFSAITYEVHVFWDLRWNVVNINHVFSEILYAKWFNYKGYFYTFKQKDIYRITLFCFSLLYQLCCVRIAYLFRPSTNHKTLCGILIIDITTQKA